MATKLRRQAKNRRTLRRQAKNRRTSSPPGEEPQNFFVAVFCAGYSLRAASKLKRVSRCFSMLTLEAGPMELVSS